MRVRVCGRARVCVCLFVYLRGASRAFCSRQPLRVRMGYSEGTQGGVSTQAVHSAAMAGGLEAGLKLMHANLGLGECPVEYPVSTP